MIQIFRLDGFWVVSEIETITESEWGDPDCVLKYPYSLEQMGDGKGTVLSVFPPFSGNREIYIRSSDVSITSDVDDALASLYHSNRKKETE